MTLYVNLNGAIHEASGLLALTVDVAPAPTDIVPALTANVSAGCVASASSEYSESGITGSAYKAFDRGDGSGWANGWSSAAQATPSAPQVLTIELPTSKVCNTYSMKIRSDVNFLSPTAWIMEGWNGTAWVEIHSVDGLSWANGETKNYTVTAPGAYSRYRWRIIASGALCQIDEIRMFS